MPYYRIVEMEKLTEEASPIAQIQRVAGDLMKAGIVTYPKGLGATPHYHPNEEQFVLILKGRRYSVLGDEERIVGPGDLIHIPRNTRHGACTLDEECVMFTVKSPAGDGVLGQDYHEAHDAAEVIERLEAKLREFS